MTAQGPALEAPVDSRFGRCANFIFIDPDTMQFEVTPNPGAMANSGAGIQAAQFVVDRETDVVLTGHVGPNAFDALTSSGVQTYVGVSGSVQNAIEQFQAGQLTAVSSATVSAHSGMGGGRGRGRGRGRR